MDGLVSKRRRVDESDAPRYTLSGSDEEDSAAVYVPVKKRREARLAQLAGKHALAARTADEERKRREDEEEAALEREDRERERKRLGARTLLIEAQEVKRRQAELSTSTASRTVLEYFIDAINFVRCIQDCLSKGIGRRESGYGCHREQTQTGLRL